MRIMYLIATLSILCACTSENSRTKSPKESKPIVEVRKSEPEKLKAEKPAIKPAVIQPEMAKPTLSSITRSSISNLKTEPVASSKGLPEQDKMKELFNQFEKVPQIFSLDPEKDTTISLAEGTEITIEAGALISNSGDEITETIAFRVKEYYNLSDILMADLSTSSNGEMIETGGMIYIDAISNGQFCQVREGGKIEVKFPPEQIKVGMQIFNGIWEEGDINWEAKEEVIDDNGVIKSRARFSEILPDFESDSAAGAVFPGGYNALQDYVSQNLRFPAETREQNIFGNVVVEFIVTRDGSLTDPRILKAVHPSLDEAALELIRNMPKWEPEKNNSIPVSSIEMLPIRFTLSGENGIITDYDEVFETLYNDDNISEASLKEVSQFSFAISNLGWINIDRFLKEDRPIRNLLARIGQTNDIDIKLVFHDIRSILSGQKEDGNFLFKNVPLNEEVTVVAIKHEDDLYHLAKKKMKISKADIDELDFKTVSLTELKSAMLKLDNEI